ncbi:hypothetical protein AVEN_218919-1 [Araneus ventricosus]|uniref:Uncharacterized protein n=1 Tax=Araneus ventricosus TaxID=182803 RepID=A0A4Y2NP97_ARAVE|nr:hypothetical protein AVEN_218919-1 [Araneus ventricosus]
MKLDPEVKICFQKVLDALLTELQKRKKTSDTNKIERKCAAINHAIISAVRRRSFLSNIQIGIELTLHRLYESKHLTDILAAMGVSISYNEISLDRNSVINAGSPKISDEAFIQNMFGKVDVNVGTLDGLNAFHAMGGIQCIAPGTAYP